MPHPDTHAPTRLPAALATEDPTPDLLAKKPHGRDEPLISRHMWRFILSQGSYQVGRGMPSHPRLACASCLIVASVPVAHFFPLCALFTLSQRNGCLLSCLPG